MKTIDVNGTKIILYQSAEELPILRYQKFNKYNIIESGIGSTIEAIGSHFGKLFEFCTHKMPEEALEETKNLYYNFYTMLEEIPIPGMAFCCLVHSISDVLLQDLTEDNLKLKCQELSDLGLTKGHVDEIVQSVKKKSMTS